MTNQERREFLKAALAAMATATGAAGCKNIVISCYTVCSTPETQTLRRAELVERLQQLAESKPPERLVRAMCYEMVYVERKELPCPACERTMILGEKDEILREHHVPLKRIQDQKVNAKLIVPEHCAECGFGLKEEKFQLEIKYADQREAVRIELEDAFELELMALFLEGQDRVDKGQRGEEALKDDVQRLRQLFGIEQ